MKATPTFISILTLNILDQTVSHTPSLSFFSLKGQICMQESLEIFIIYGVSFSLKTLHPRDKRKTTPQSSLHTFAPPDSG